MSLCILSFILLPKKLGNFSPVLSFEWLLNSSAQKRTSLPDLPWLLKPTHRSIKIEVPDYCNDCPEVIREVHLCDVVEIFNTVGAASL